ncbi:hypothetical protein EJ04DRAFT_269578 [Polyplosphaeria fusca]|uniref:25S rRNA (Uridine(2843)-N(3))-methyltransferase n=1 Tax=Polyplosphaeria fusca TaxID=682080 RepID=A0A9P4QTJ6_9PLEO|nr:hypothetical protein EJ04DRAFT_269578 [Polyplosphaeria fusca]
MPPSKTNAKSKPRKNDKKQSVTCQTPSSPQVTTELQTLLLDIFSRSFAERLQSDIHPLLQEVKGHLYNRDFAAAFGRDDYLETYAARWSPSRALGYVQALVDLEPHLGLVGKDVEGEPAPSSKIVCLGGGAGAELVALAGFLHPTIHKSARGSSARSFDIVAIDIANWTHVVEKLHHSVCTAPPISPYASAASRSANAPLVATDHFHATFYQHDLLNTDFSILNPLLQDAKLITLMFTLNELYSTSISLTQTFLLGLTASLPAEAFLLIVDSPGSYSTINLNGTEKKYPMQWLLDHTLLRQGEKGEAAVWHKVLEDESRWCRLPSSLKYPIELENLRFQLHLYKKMG